MNAPAVPLLQGLVEHVEPAAIAGPQASAAFKLGQILKEVIHAVPSAFQGENAILQACRDVDSFISAFVKKSEMPALADGYQRAMVEDVAMRIAPNTGFSIPMAQGPGIDYDRLAAAIVRQMAVRAEPDISQEPPPAPASAPDGAPQ